jgi:hypothetical protein
LGLCPEHFGLEKKNEIIFTIFLMYPNLVVSRVCFLVF